jgi:hypothetical protein
MDQKSKEALEGLGAMLGEALRQKLRQGLLEACERGDEEKAAECLGLGARAQSEGYAVKDSPLALAIASGSVGLVERVARAAWLERASAENDGDDFGSSGPVAARLSALDAQEKGGRFHAAILRGTLGDMDEPSRRWLGCAVEGDVEAARMALEDGARPDAVNHLGMDALMLSARRGRVEMVRWLLDSGRGDPSRRPGKSAKLNALSMALALDFGRTGPSRDAGRRACALMLAPLSDCESPRLGFGVTMLAAAALTKWPDVVRAMMPRCDVNALSGPLGKAIVCATRSCEGFEGEAAQIVEDLWGVTDLTQDEGRKKTALSALRASKMSEHVERLLARDEALRVAKELSESSLEGQTRRGPRRF